MPSIATVSRAIVSRAIVSRTIVSRAIVCKNYSHSFNDFATYKGTE